VSKKDIRISPNAIYGEKIIGISIEKYNQLKEDYAQTMVDRNSYLLEKEMLEEKVKQLETELYFCRRNRKMENVIGEK